LKTPFTTNRQNIKYPQSVDEIITRVVGLSEKFIDVIPYVMLQPCMANKREYKVVCLGGVPQYVASINRPSSGPSFSAFPHARLFSFADSAIQRAKGNGCPGLIISGLLRVDIFINKSQQFIVNEFESLDAEYCSSEHVNEASTKMFLENYWHKVISSCLGN
jgi:hypothetical protein